MDDADEELQLDIDVLLESFCHLAERLITCAKDAERRQDISCLSDTCSSMETLLEFGLSFEDYFPECVHGSFKEVAIISSLTK